MNKSDIMKNVLAFKDIFYKLFPFGGPLDSRSD